MLPRRPGLLHHQQGILGVPAAPVRSTEGHQDTQEQACVEFHCPPVLIMAAVILPTSAPVDYVLTLSPSSAAVLFYKSGKST
jgi:hypothetical protein